MGQTATILQLSTKVWSSFLKLTFDLLPLGAINGRRTLEKQADAAGHEHETGNIRIPSASGSLQEMSSTLLP